MYHIFFARVKILLPMFPYVYSPTTQLLEHRKEEIKTPSHLLLQSSSSDTLTILCRYTINYLQHSIDKSQLQ